MNDIDKLLQTGANIKIEVTATDLKDFGIEIAKQSFEALQKVTVGKKDYKYLGVENVCALFGISRVTLWQWDKKGITKPIRIGNLKRYLSSDIEAMAEQHAK